MPEAEDGRFLFYKIEIVVYVCLSNVVIGGWQVGSVCH